MSGVVSSKLAFYQVDVLNICIRLHGFLGDGLNREISSNGYVNLAQENLSLRVLK